MSGNGRGRAARRPEVVGLRRGRGAHRTTSTPGHDLERPGRRWGWHPLTADWADRLVGESPVRAGDLILDLGAGDGALTAALLARGARVLAVELHSRRAGRLRERFAGCDVRVLEVDLRDLRLPARPFRVVANPPFALTSALVRTLLASNLLLSADLVLQRAAAQRWAERGGGRRHRLSVGARIPRAAFRHAPAVDAAVLRFRRIR